MSKFKFPLEKLLDYRSSIETKKMEKLAFHRCKKKELEDSLTVIQEKYLSYRDKTPTSKINIQLFTHQLVYMDCLRGQIDSKFKEVAELEQQVEICRKELTEAMRDKKILVNLKEKQEDLYSKETNIRELKEINEAALIRFYKI